MIKLVIKRRDAFSFMLEVDAPSLPGSPPVGRGESIYEALGQWLHFHRERLGIEIEVDESATEFETARRQAELLQR